MDDNSTFRISISDFLETGIISNRELTINYIENLQNKLRDVTDLANKRKAKILRLRERYSLLKNDNKEKSDELRRMSDELMKSIGKIEELRMFQKRLVDLLSSPVTDNSAYRRNEMIRRSASFCSPTSDRSASVRRSLSLGREQDRNDYSRRILEDVRNDIRPESDRSCHLCSAEHSRSPSMVPQNSVNKYRSRSTRPKTIQ
ncbi:uncharacterized protein LOC144428352 [Styela clava]